MHEDEPHPPDSLTPEHGSFPPTCWSLVAAAGSDRTVSEAALERLCRDYWPPLYTFLRSRGCSVEDAKDLTQTLLAGLVARDAFDGLSADRGRFRTFLLRCAKNLLATDWRARNARKRGSGAVHVPIDTEEGEALFASLAADNGTNPEILYARHWSNRLLRRVMTRLEESYVKEGKGDLFHKLQPMIAGVEERGRYGELAAELDVSEASLRMMVFRIRQRYRALLHDEIAQTVLTPSEVDDEINFLMRLYADG